MCILIEEFVSRAIHSKLHSAVSIQLFIFYFLFLVGCAVVFLDLEMEEVDYIPKR